MTLRKRQTTKSHERIINIEGDDIKIVHVGFEISDSAWEKFQEKMRQYYGEGAIQKKSHAMRILVNALNLELITLEALEKQIEEKAKHIKDVIYI